MYLYVTEQEKKIPVHKYFWKVIYNRENEAAIAFVGLNDPYQNESENIDIPCADISDEILWRTWKQQDIKRGFMYCCEVNDEFRKFIPVLPQFTTTKVLI